MYAPGRSVKDIIIRTIGGIQGRAIDQLRVCIDVTFVILIIVLCLCKRMFFLLGNTL